MPKWLIWIALFAIGLFAWVSAPRASNIQTACVIAVPEYNMVMWVEGNQLYLGHYKDRGDHLDWDTQNIPNAAKKLVSNPPKQYRGTIRVRVVGCT
jgi:hypothetical protein